MPTVYFYAHSLFFPLATNSPRKSYLDFFGLKIDRQTYSAFWGSMFVCLFVCGDVKPEYFTPWTSQGNFFTKSLTFPFFARVLSEDRLH